VVTKRHTNQRRYKHTPTLSRNNNKLAPYGTNGRLYTTDVSAKFKVTRQKQI